MDSVIMTTPSNSMRLRSRLRSAANTICARSSRSRSGSVKQRGSVRHLGPRQQPQGPINRPRPPLPHTPHYGTITREVYNAWCGRLGDVTRIPSDSVQALFNDMQLYPSKNQVVEMLQCARQCGHRNSSHFLTFGEFCVFAGELRRGGARNRQHQQQSCQQHNTSQQQQQRTLSINKTSTSLSQCEVFLGGSCNPTTWRADIAIPTLSKLGITYYNPQVSQWGPELMAAEHSAKESALVLLFVVDSQTRCVAGMLEVAHLVAKQRCLVLVVHPFSRNQAIMGETLSTQEFEDLTEGQATLLTIVRNQGVTVHSNLSTALQCTVNLLRGHDAIVDNVTERKLSDKLMKLREVFDSMDTNHTGELSLSEVSYAYHQLTGSSLRISDLNAIMNLSQQQQRRGNDPADVRITFEQFCGIVAEFTSADGCNVNGTDDWINQSHQRQPSNINYRPRNGYTNGTSHDHNHIHCDIYLGGSCMKHTTWRQNIAIPLLKHYGITYYNPSLHENNETNGDVNDNSPNSMASQDLLQNIDIMNNSKIVLFVITNETRSITCMILAAHYIALRKNVVLCVQQLPLEKCIIGSDVITKQAIKDYNRARAYLSDLAKHENVPTFESVQEAVQCAVNLVRT